MALTLTLSALPSDKVAGIYKIRGVDGRMPDRALFLHPLAAASFMRDLAPVLTLSDILRSPESSLEAVRAGRGAQPPGFSLHNFGIAIDHEVDKALRVLGFGKDKAKLDAWFEARGWYCHRRDGQRGSEDWHLNYLAAGTALGFGPVTISPKVRSTAGYGEELIQRIHGSNLAPDDVACQVALKRTRFYAGEIDGQIGAQSKESTRAFQRAWGIKETGSLDARTRRTLALVACDRAIV